MAVWPVSLAVVSAGRCAPRRMSPSMQRLPVRGFTLIELVITLGIIVLLLAVATPALNLLSGQRSLESAQNQIAAELGVVRARVLSLQRDGGLIFYLDQATNRVAMRYVSAVEALSAVGLVRRIELVAGFDATLLPEGVAMQFLYPGNVAGGLQSQHRYTGFNRLEAAPNKSVAFGGVVLFDARGRVMVTPYLLGDSPVMDDLFGTASATQSVRRSELGMVLMDRASFTSRFDLGENLDDYDGQEQAEETWLDENGRLILLNRYNGTFLE